VLREISKFGFDDPENASMKNLAYGGHRNSHIYAAVVEQVFNISERDQKSNVHQWGSQQVRQHSL
tara:strand:- start:132 stop:326 length:195 start_codon:yes stop_codon:yes gene_type:complete